MDDADLTAILSSVRDFVRTEVVPLEEQIENSSLYFEESSKVWFLFTNHIGIRPQTHQEYTDAIWVYWSHDLTRWNPEDKAIVLDSHNCTWSENVIGLPSVLRVGNRLALYYDGYTGEDFWHMGRDIGLAWLPLPLIAPSLLSAVHGAAIPALPLHMHLTLPGWLHIPVPLVSTLVEGAPGAGLATATASRTLPPPRPARTLRSHEALGSLSR